MGGRSPPGFVLNVEGLQVLAILANPSETIRPAVILPGHLLHQNFTAIQVDLGGLPNVFAGLLAGCGIKCPRNFVFCQIQLHQVDSIGVQGGAEGRESEIGDVRVGHFFCVLC